ncbi:MAG: amidase [Proteobacteria bacterium]|nr:amidase [Pseudomonadota bacterium]
MHLSDYDDRDATSLAELVSKGEIAPKELLEDAIERIEARNPALNAVVHTMYDRARGRADKLPDGPLKGVPFLVKDLKLKIAGEPTTNSTKLEVGNIAKRSSVTADRYEAAGLQIIGKTNTPEFGIMGITESALRGPCRNPWNTDHTPGGSSGGSSAAVAARMVPAAHSGDGGGSIRIPASHTGLFGLKPTRGRVTMAPFAGEAWGGFVQEHVLCRSVRDSAAFLDIEDVVTPGEPYGVPRNDRPWLEEVGADPGKLRVAFTRENLYAGEPHPDCVAGVDKAVQLLKDMGHEVVEAMPPFDKAKMVHAYFLTVATGIAWFVEDTSRRAGRKPRASDYEPATWLLSQIGHKAKSWELLDAQVTMQRTGREVGDFFETHDLFVSPAVGRPPARIGELLPTSSENAQLALLRTMNVRPLLDLSLAKMGDSKLSWTPNTQLFNQTGQPAMSVPLHWNDAGLPIGVQFASRFGDEATLFRIAAELEKAAPWADRKPASVS